MQTDATVVAQRWAQNLGGSTDKVKAGIMAVQQSPTEKAAAQQNAYVQGVQAAASSGKWQRGLQRVTLAQWQQAAISKGLMRIGAGAQAALPKMQSFLSQWLPYMQQAQQRLASTPRGSYEQNKQRMIAQIDFAHGFQRQQ